MLKRNVHFRSSAAHCVDDSLLESPIDIYKGILESKAVKHS